MMHEMMDGDRDTECAACSSILFLLKTSREQLASFNSGEGKSLCRWKKTTYLMTFYTQLPFIVVC